MQGKNNPDDYEWASYADQITKVVIEDGITKIAKGAFFEYSNLESVYIGNTVTVIDDQAFAFCSNLKNVTIPASVTEIATSAFSNCTNLKDVSFENGSKLETLGDSVFSGSGLTKVTLPSCLQEIGNGAYAGCESLSEAMLPEGLVTIGAGAFQDCNAIKTLGLPSTLEGIKADAFSGCFNIQRLELNTSCDISAIPYQNSLTTVVIGDSVTFIPNNAFFDCVNLSNVTIGKSVEVIGSNSFRNCTALKSVTIPGSVLEIDMGAFSFAGLSSVVIPDSVTELGSSAFAYCANLESVQLGKNLFYLDGTTFENCTSLKEINLKNITEIGFEAFSGCTSLTNVELDAVKTIGYSAFKDCTALKEITLPETLVQLEHGAFFGCIALADVTLPESLNTLDGTMFFNCTSLVEITIPAGVENMGGRVFSGCSKLTTIYFEGDAPVFSEDSFDGVTCEVVYPVDNETWTEEVRQNYGGNLTWVSPHTHDYTDVLPVFDASTKQHIWNCSTCGEPKTESCSFKCVILKEATPKAPGVRQFTCSVCSGSYQEEYMLRLAGNDRIGTALSVAAALKNTLKVEKFDSIILAAGGSGQDQTKFADALSGSYLASAKNAPILLYTKGDLAQANLEFIAENLSEDGTIYLLGGNVSIPAEVEAALVEAGYTVKRLAGDDRYLTNLAILKEVGVEGVDEVLIAGGQGFADSLSASATGLPIMLVKGSKTTLTEAQIEFLKSVEGKKITILGGNAAVSAELEAAIEEVVGKDVERVFGETREETSVMIAKKYFPEAKMALITYSKMYPDGLAGGVLANVLGAPLLLTKAGSESIANEYIEEIGISSGYVLGGSAVMTDETARLVFGLNSDTVIVSK
jgi:putative cell wall-binding protein